MQDKVSVDKVLQSKDLMLKKADFEDWKAMYRNVWSRPETARFMAWQVTESEEAARERMRKTIAYQENHDTYLVYEKNSREAIGFAGVEEIAPHIYQEAGIALGPEYVGRGYGKQILELLLKYCKALGGEQFFYSSREKNTASRALAMSCGFTLHRLEKKQDLKTNESYVLEVYGRSL